MIGLKESFQLIYINTHLRICETLPLRITCMLINHYIQYLTIMDKKASYLPLA